MLKRLSLIFLAILSFLPEHAYASDAVRVAVLPFSVQSQQDLGYLQDQIAGVIAKYLREEGAAVIDGPAASISAWKTSERGIDDIRGIGAKIGADVLIWGSLTMIGSQFSLDAKMLPALGESAPKVFYTEGSGIETLVGKVRQLAKDISLKLFKREKIVEIRIAGNKRIESDAIRKMIKTQPGDAFSPKSLSDDLKAIYAMGYFDDIRIESGETPQGKIVTFHVTEKPTIRKISFTGNHVFEDKKLREAMTLKTGSILNMFTIKSNVERIEALYKGKNYQNVKVTYKLEALEHNQSDLEFTIEEGEKVRIKRIEFIGNTAFSAKTLKGIMKSSEKGFWSWLTSSGDFNREDLNQDRGRIEAYYQNHGYIQARVAEPQVKTEKSWIFLTIKIEEGPRYKVGAVKIAGDLIQPEAKLLETLKINKEPYFNREVVRNDVLHLTDMYSDKGYAYAEIIPRIDREPEKRQVDITYTVKEGKPVYFEKINITGNTKTRDYVIRRELKIFEQGRYNGELLKQGVRNLNRLDYFSDVKVNNTKGSADDKMILDINVTEKPTGAFSFGGGYSSVEKVFGMASISQRNLFGRGQTLELRGMAGSVTQQYTLSFTEPWLFGIPLEAGFDLYSWNTIYDNYEKDSVGGKLRFSYPVWDFTRAYLTYNYEVSNVKNATALAPLGILDIKGQHDLSSISTSLRYDSRDRIFNPSKGQDNSITFEYAGLGGDIKYIKYLGDAGIFFPLFWDTVAHLHARGGFVQEISGGILPDYEKFYLGGIDSLRGFAWQEIGVEKNGILSGGDKFVQGNLEYIFPLVKKAGVMGLFFFDTGNVADVGQTIDFGNLRQSAGFGIRWYSPVGPIRLENGYIINPKPGESTGGRWEFSMGSVF
jgi:outer membrane protein insertion porin family